MGQPCKETGTINHNHVVFSLLFDGRGRAGIVVLRTTCNQNPLRVL